MKMSKGAIVRAFSTGRASARPYVPGSSNRSGNDDSALDHAEELRQCIRWLQRDADTIVQAAPGHPARGSRNMKGLRPFACI
jgi:hypothetical protein